MQGSLPFYKQKVHWRVKAVFSKAFLCAQFSMFFNVNGFWFGEDWKMRVCVCESRILSRLSPKHISNTQWYGICHCHCVPNPCVL